jgi:hypothetical protein
MLTKSLKHFVLAMILLATIAMPVLVYAKGSAKAAKAANAEVAAKAKAAEIAAATTANANDTVNYEDPNLAMTSAFVSENVQNCLRGDNQTGTADGCISSHGLNKVVNGNSGEVYIVHSGDPDSTRAPSSTKSIGK